MPNVVGTTKDGEPIYEVHSVRLMLRGNATHFNRILACSKCGRDVLGTPVLTAADLDHAASSVICKECVRTAPAPMADNGSRRPAARPQPEPALTVPPPRVRPVVATNGAQAAPAPGPPPVKGEVARSPAEAQVRDRVAAGTEPPANHGSDRAGLVDVQALARVVEERLGERLTERLRETLRAQGTNMGVAFDERLRELQSAVERLTAAGEDAARSREALDVRLKALADEGVQAAQAQDERLQGLERRVRRASESRRTELDSLRSAVAEIGSASSASSASAGATVDRVAVVEDQVRRLPDAVAELDGIQQQMSMRLDKLAERVARAAAGDDARLVSVEQRLGEGLAAQQAGTEASVAALAAVVEAGTRRLQSVEDRIGRSDEELAELDELQAALDEGLGELRGQLADLDEQEADATAAVMARVEALERRMEQSPSGSRRSPGAGPAQEVRRSRPFGRATAGTAGELSALSEVTDSLTWRHDQLEMRMSMLERTGDEAARAVDGQFAALHKQLEAQHQALVALNEAVEGLKRKKAVATRPTKTPKT